MPINFALNGRAVCSTAQPMARLLDVLREEHRHTGAKEGCGEGECGACTVIIDGRAVNSCLIPVVQVGGAHVETVEGLADGERLSRLQDAFVRCGATQCGICTPGFLMSAEALLRAQPHPTRGQVREALAGNLCRCTGYQRIVDAVCEALA